jgi:hypothetical protein
MANQRTVPPHTRLAEVVACLSLTTDPATDQLLEHGLRRTLLAVWLGEDLGLNSDELRDVYYVALLGTVGCTIEGAAFAEFFKDEIAFAERVVTVDPTSRLGLAAFVLSKAGEGDPPLRRARKVIHVALAGPSATQVVCRWTARGTHTGAYADIPQTGKQGVISGLTIFRIADGKAADCWTQADYLGLLRQLGVIPAPALAC